MFREYRYSKLEKYNKYTKYEFCHISFTGSQFVLEFHSIGYRRITPYHRIVGNFHIVGDKLILNAMQQYSIKFDLDETVNYYLKFIKYQKTEKYIKKARKINVSKMECVDLKMEKIEMEIRPTKLILLSNVLITGNYELMFV